MFLLIVIVILIAATSILANIYGWIFSFQQNYGDLENYSNSHYAAISAIERWLLVTKYKNPNFVWSGWFIWTWNWWEISDLFSGNFGDINKNNNWLHRIIDSQCNNELWILKNNQTLVFQTYIYNNTQSYTWNNATTTKWISNIWTLNGTIENIDSSINLINGSLYRQINWDNKISWYTWFVSSSWNTMINYWTINNTPAITFNASTINPLWTTNTWDILCTQNWCYTGSTINNLITDDKWILFYIQNRLTDNNNNQIWEIKYEFTNNFSWNCQNYYINWTAIIWRYKQELSIKKPSFNYRNPNRKQFIFPYYN